MGLIPIKVGICPLLSPGVLHGSWERYLAIFRFRNTSLRDGQISESKSDEWLDRIHSGIIWGQNVSTGQGIGRGGLLEDIEKAVSNQSFLMEDQVSKFIGPNWV